MTSLERKKHMDVVELTILAIVILTLLYLGLVHTFILPLLTKGSNERKLIDGGIPSETVKEIANRMKDYSVDYDLDIRRKEGDFLKKYENYSLKIRLFPIEYQTFRRVKVEFEPIFALDDLWRGRGAALEVAEPLNLKIRGHTRHEEWGNRIKERGLGSKLTRMILGLRKNRPWFKINIPPINKKYKYRRIVGKAHLNIRYPRGAILEFKNYDENLNRPVEFYVVSPEEMKIIRKFPRRFGRKNILCLILSVIILVKILRREPG